MKSRRIFKESYISKNISNSKIPISPKEENYNNKFNTYKSITKYTKKDVDMIIKIQRWWKSIFLKLR
jgi:ADP-heptose:LPS heptosyltransferase